MLLRIGRNGSVVVDVVDVVIGDGTDGVFGGMCRRCSRQWR